MTEAQHQPNLDGRIRPASYIKKWNRSAPRRQANVARQWIVEVFTFPLQPRQDSIRCTFCSVYVPHSSNIGLLVDECVHRILLYYEDCGMLCSFILCDTTCTVLMTMMMIGSAVGLAVVVKCFLKIHCTWRWRYVFFTPSMNHAVSMQSNRNILVWFIHIYIQLGCVGWMEHRDTWTGSPGAICLSLYKLECSIAVNIFILNKQYYLLWYLSWIHGDYQGNYCENWCRSGRSRVNRRCSPKYLFNFVSIQWGSSSVELIKSSEGRHTSTRHQLLTNW